ncbi:hypothetical protein AVEN_232526-1 [Araneus ventricosus]|uniref:Uncharacterized protein n=1 Tax=Araneus ventricosus TaxID=182803 RepID=A0A4Y2UKZ6_ARAVE|nr:hypothetical protein AVEN_232526-1 [Araneus ventricosus]
MLGNRHTNPLCYGLPPHNLLPYGINQPTTLAIFTVESNAIVPFPQSWPTFSQITTSVTEHPLPPAMREYKTRQTSTVQSASSAFSSEMESLVSPVQHSTSPPLQPIIPK